MVTAEYKQSNDEYVLVNVVVDNKSEKTDRFYTYKAGLDIEIGDAVTVSFANFKKPITGYVFETNVKTDYPEDRIKWINSVEKNRSLTSEIIDTSLWMCSRYGVKYIDAVKMFTAKGKRENNVKVIKSGNFEEQEYELSGEQRIALQKIEGAIQEGKHHAFLIKGVTNSGKTEVYMRAVERVRKEGKTAIVLVPEIALAGQMEKRFKARFGEDAVAVLHSKLTTTQRLNEWLKLRSGKAVIAVGARTAVFAPLENIGIIIIDEEHEVTYKADFNPKFETIDVAYRRSKYFDGVLLLGSATPSVVSYSRVRDNIYELIEMNERIGNSTMPEVEIVDMKQEVRNGNLGSLSHKLIDEMKICLENGEQVILFLNRRGFNTSIMCAECGWKMTCSECNISLTYHKSASSAVCHYCNRKYHLPKICPECGSKYIRYGGTGTEKVEETVAEIFGDYRVERFDLDTAVSQREIDRIISGFMKGDIDVLVGTQILAKGLDFKNVGLVGIINPDLELAIPDYRSDERCFQLITQVSGRAGRTGGKSKVIIQTFDPENETIISAAENDYDRFYKGEILHRKIMNYPPFSDIINISFVDRKGRRTESPSTYDYASDFKAMLEKKTNLAKGAVFYDVQEDNRYSNAERNKVYFLIKAPKGSRSGFVNAYRNYRDKMINDGAEVYIEIDVNPYGVI